MTKRRHVRHRGEAQERPSGESQAYSPLLRAGEPPRSAGGSREQGGATRCEESGVVSLVFVLGERNCSLFWRCAFRWYSFWFEEAAIPDRRYVRFAHAAYREASMVQQCRAVLLLRLHNKNRISAHTAARQSPWKMSLSRTLWLESVTGHKGLVRLLCPPDDCREIQKSQSRFVDLAPCVRTAVCAKFHGASPRLTRPNACPRQFLSHRRIATCP